MFVVVYTLNLSNFWIIDPQSSEYGVYLEASNELSSRCEVYHRADLWDVAAAAAYDDVTCSCCCCPCARLCL